MEFVYSVATPLHPVLGALDLRAGLRFLEEGIGLKAV